MYSAQVQPGARGVNRRRKGRASCGKARKSRVLLTVVGRVGEGAVRHCRDARMHPNERVDFGNSTVVVGIGKRIVRGLEHV